MNIEIFSRMNDGRWELVGTGKLQGNQIVDCAADIGDAVYGALQGAIEYDTTTGQPVAGEYSREVDGAEWQVVVA